MRGCRQLVPESLQLPWGAGGPSGGGEAASSVMPLLPGPLKRHSGTGAAPLPAEPGLPSSARVGAGGLVWYRSSRPGLQPCSAAQAAVPAVTAKGKAPALACWLVRGRRCSRFGSAYRRNG